MRSLIRIILPSDKLKSVGSCLVWTDVDQQLIVRIRVWSCTLVNRVRNITECTARIIELISLDGDRSAGREANGVKACHQDVPRASRESRAAYHFD